MHGGTCSFHMPVIMLEIFEAAEAGDVVELRYWMGVPFTSAPEVKSLQAESTEKTADHDVRVRPDPPELSSMNTTGRSIPLQYFQTSWYL